LTSVPLYSDLNFWRWRLKSSLLSSQRVRLPTAGRSVYVANVAERVFRLLGHKRQTWQKGQSNTHSKKGAKQSVVTYKAINVGNFSRCGHEALYPASKTNL
jgi:hypothetical protein